MLRDARRAVIVADDDEALRLLCRVNLELEGYRVLEAASAQEVKRLLESEDASLVLLDLNLGRDDGADVARALRASRPDIPIVFLTGSAPALDQRTRSIADAVLPKPFRLEDLSETVQRLAGR